MSLSLEPRGLTIRWTDRSLASQCGAFVPASLFLEYEVPSPVELGAVYGPLFEAVALCAAGGGGGGGNGGGSGGGGGSSLPPDLVEMSYPGPDAEISFASVPSSSFGDASASPAADRPVPRSSSVRSRVLLTTCDLPRSADLSESWGSLAASFTLTPSSLLKEAAEGLEWASGDGRVTVAPIPGATAELGRRVAASLEAEDAAGSGVRIELPQKALGGGTCRAARVSHLYTRRALRAACGSVPAGAAGSAGAGGADQSGSSGSAGGQAAGGAAGTSLQGSTKVSIDEGGMLRITHALPQLLRLGRARRDGPGGARPSATPAVPSQLENRAGGFEDVVVVQHVLLPLVNDTTDD